MESGSIRDFHFSMLHSTAVRVLTLAFATHIRFLSEGVDTIRTTAFKALKYYAYYVST